MHGGLTAFLLVAALAPVPAAPAPEPVVASVEVATRAPNNPRAKIWYRLPRGHDPARRERWRVLVLFGGRKMCARVFFIPLSADRSVFRAQNAVHA